MTSTSTHPAATHEPPVTVRAAGIVVAVTTLLALVAIAFALPAARSGPHDVPIGAAGPQAAGGQIAEMLDQKAPGAFAVTYYPSEAALREAIGNRDVYGGIALPAQPGTEPALLIATGAGPMVAQVLTQLGTQLGQQTGIPLRTEDLAPPTARDPRGAGVAASALPITLAGILPAIALVLALRTEIWARLTTAIVFSVVAGVTIAALLRYVLGSIEHNFWGVSAGLALGVAAALLFVLGLGSLFGRAGLAVGAALALLVGNPLSGLASAPELLPAGWGALGQLLPQGATATLLRSTAFFAGAGASTAVLVLTGWALAGAAMIVAAAVRQQTTSAAVT
ncbi:ABC transporter permease [Mycolicibacterium sp. BiH015]|uniref:ABC transporter permease n=1 Tax=Mycolicibacterium sp. BiH015 TaxID=3018808 RepID=UPI0022E75AA9|nr:ABC transporter permease [Mycolicibacterium sp. BiH015]MDA2891517.1 ABC transporter permease [Mycolicibacterium sp. BiH015]